MRRRVLAAIFASTALVILIGAIERFDTLAEGLRATYFASPDWSPPAARTTVDRRPSTAAIVAAWDGSPPAVFSAAWTGSLIVLRDATYTFATTSDDGSFVAVDGKPVVDNGGNHVALTKSGSAFLTRGVHALAINYFQKGGGFELSLLWDGGTGGALDTLPGWRLTPKRPGFARFAATVVARRVLAASEWIWVTLLVVGAGLAGWSLLEKLAVSLRRQGAGAAFAAVLAISMALNVVGIWSGLAAHTSWFGTELTPADVFGGLAHRFSSGWWVFYPPVHFYVLTAAYSPLLLLDWLGRIDTTSGGAYNVLFLIGRLVSVAAGAGVVVSLYLCGARAFSKRAGVFAAASIALVAPFICYAKMANLDVPYLFWFTASLVFYVRLAEKPSGRDMILFAACATLAVCTKDQAYGLYLGVPAVLVYVVWRANRAAGIPRPLVRALLDRRILAAAATAAIVFALGENLLFNFRGFLGHFGIITTDASHSERVYEPTVSGWLQLAALTARLDQESWGWPLFIASLAGFVVAVSAKETRRAALLLAVPVVTYTFGFLAIILYNYDRHMLPVCAVQALFAGVALDRLFANRASVWRRAVVASVLVYSFLYASMADVLMVRDSRYVVEAWLRERVGPDQVVGAVFPIRNRPNLEGFQVEDVGTIDELRRHSPAYYVIDADYARAVPPDSDTGRLLAGLRQASLGYTLALRYRSPAPWPWLPGAHPELVGPRLDTHVSSTLRDINPTFEVYKRGS